MTKDYYEKNKTHVSAKSKSWAAKNPDKRRAISRKHSRKVNGATPESLRVSATYKGRRAEMLVLSLLKGAVDMNSNGLNKPYDILWNGFTVDVKSAEIYKRIPSKRHQTGQWWTFGSAGKSKADFYFCIAMHEGIPVNYWLIPGDHYGRSGITIGYHKSKFNEWVFKPTVK